MTFWQANLQKSRQSEEDHYEEANCSANLSNNISQIRTSPQSSIPRQFYPKTTISKAGANSPAGPRTIAAVPCWAFEFLTLLGKQLGHDFVTQTLKRVSWRLTTCFSGIGCAELARDPFFGLRVESF